MSPQCSGGRISIFLGFDGPSAYLECFRLVKDPASFLTKPSKDNDKQYLRKVSLRDVVVWPPHVYKKSHKIDIYCLLVLMNKSMHPDPPALCFPNLQRCCVTQAWQSMTLTLIQRLAQSFSSASWLNQTILASHSETGDGVCSLPKGMALEFLDPVGELKPAG